MYARVLFTDFCKGFDLVDHHALLHELEILSMTVSSNGLKPFCMTVNKGLE